MKGVDYPEELIRMFDLLTWDPMGSLLQDHFTAKEVLQWACEHGIR